MRVRAVVAVLMLGVASGCSGANPVDETQVDRSTPDELTSCLPTTATNAQHVSAGRAYTKNVTFLGFHLTGYFATGTNESLGVSPSTRTTLYQIAPGVYSNKKNECPTGGGTGGATGAGGAVGTGGAVGAGGAVGTGGAVGAGGRVGTGGAVGAGGRVGTGGVVGTGGTISAGGTPNTGGVSASGGRSSTGGVTGSGGVTGAGGTVTTMGEPKIPAAPTDCPVLKTGSVTVLGQQVQLWVGQKQASKKGSVMFYWHGTGSSSSEASLLGNALNEIQADGGIVASFTTSLATGTSTGNNVWYTDDFKMADVILACANQQLNIDTHRIYTAGCSAGGLQAGSMAYLRSSYLAGSMPNSGGIISFFVNKFEDPSHIPSIITAHGGDSDQVVISFATTSTDACQGVKNAGGIAVDCNHGGGHCQAPADLIADQWTFLKAHPFGVNPDPYAGGLPSNFPTYCKQF
jgi:poly(3-hydroxybutyrate) depolymerase